DRFFHAVQARIDPRVFQRRRIGIDGDYFALEAVAHPEQRRRDRQYSRAGAGIEDRLGRARGYQRFDRAQSAGGRGMVPGAESPRGLDDDGGSAALILALPRRHDQHSPSDAKRPKPFHPKRGPSRIDDSPDAPIATAGASAVARGVSEHPGPLHHESEPRQLGCGDLVEVRFERDGLILARARQLHPGDGASDGAARDEDSGGFIREVRMGAEYRPGVTLPGCGCALHISQPLTLASAQISSEARFARAGVTPAPSIKAPRRWRARPLPWDAGGFARALDERVNSHHY